MAFSHNHQRPSRRGHSAFPQQGHMTYMQDPAEGSDASELFMGQYEFTEELSVDPRNLTLDQIGLGGNELLQDFGNLDNFQPEIDPSGHPENYLTESSYINSNYPDSSYVVSGESA